MVLVKLALIFVATYAVVFIALVARRKVRSPEKSWLNCAVNIALSPMRYFRLGPFKQGKISLDSCVKYAMKKAKLTDFGGNGADFVHMYDTIMSSESFKKEKFHNIGYVSASVEINMCLSRRLTFVKYLTDNPAILTVPVNCPVFVMGLPRTGTTLLHRLLSLDPAVRSPLTWELLNPVPRVNGQSGSAADLKAHELDRNRRFKFVEKVIETRRFLGDDSLAHIHEVAADLPEECLLCLTDNLPCLPMLLYDDYLNVDAFLSVDATPAYIAYRKYLQMLSYQTNDFPNNNNVKEPKRWMLKCPIHMFYPKQLAKAFPDAKLIWNHRHPVSAVPSLCSLLKAFHMLYYEPECRDDKYLGNRIKYATEKLLQQTPIDLKESGLDCADVVYNDLIKDPKKVVKSIYAQFKWIYSDEYDTILENYLEKNSEERAALKKQQGHNLHTYTPEEFGLTAEELCTGKFDEYCKKFNVPMSKG